MTKTERELDAIRSKPCMDLTSAEIDRLTAQEQRWVLSYRASQRRLNPSKAA